MAEFKKLGLPLGADAEQHVSVDQDFLRQLSTLDFTAVQKESYSKRYANTGQWLLESSDFQAWLVSESGQHSVLWYQGDPGVGKTVITSIAVNHVTETNGGGATAIVYIYYDYANATTVALENILGSFVRQLVEQTCHAGTTAELKTFLNNPAKNRKMTEVDLSLWIETLSKDFDRVYTFVDALDECPEDQRDKLMRRLQRYSLGNVRVFLPSRSNVDVKVQIPLAIRAGIAAVSDDITAFVESKIHDTSSLARLTKTDPELRKHIVRTICSQANGMFLLARLQVMSLSSQISPGGVMSALERLPTDLFTIYDQIIDRIRDQPTKFAKLGLGVLSTIFGAMRPLRANELRHALAIRPGNSDLDFGEIVGLETMFSVTAGLVTTYVAEDEEEEQESLRLVHYTLQEYFELNQRRLFPEPELDMARKCLSYLSLNEFGSGRCDKLQSTERRMKKFHFLDYAAHHWTDHLRGVQTELMDRSLAFVQDEMKTSAWLGCVEFCDLTGPGLSTSIDLPLDPAFLAANFHLLELFTRLILSRDINIRNKRGETPLIRAVDWEPWLDDGEPPFLLSRDTDQYAIVQFILDRNADINARDLYGWTAAFHASVQLQRGNFVPALGPWC